MKRINNSYQLQLEKKRLKLQKETIEQNIRNNWAELKTQISPKNIAKEAFLPIIGHKTIQNIESESILKSTIVFGLSLLAKKMVDEADRKLGEVFNH